MSNQAWYKLVRKLVQPNRAQGAHLDVGQGDLKPRLHHARDGGAWVGREVRLCVRGCECSVWWRALLVLCASRFTAHCRHADGSHTHGTATRAALGTAQAAASASATHWSPPKP